MALLFLDSCDLYATREQIARRWEPNGTSTSYINVSATAGRWGRRAIQLASAGTGQILRHIPPRQTVILAFAARFTRTRSPAISTVSASSTVAVISAGSRSPRGARPPTQARFSSSMPRLRPRPIPRTPVSAVTPGQGQSATI